MPPGPWTDVQIEEAHLEEVFFEYLRLIRDTAYEAEISDQEDFSTKVTLLFSTPQETAIVPNSIKLNDVELDDWAYPLDLEYITQLTLATLNENVTLEVKADSDIQVNIDPHNVTAGAGSATARVAGFNQQIIQWVITCTKGDDTTIYRLTVEVTAPVSFDFNDLDSRAPTTPEYDALAVAGSTLWVRNKPLSLVEAANTTDGSFDAEMNFTFPSAEESSPNPKIATDGSTLWVSRYGQHKRQGTPTLVLAREFEVRESSFFWHVHSRRLNPPESYISAIVNNHRLDSNTYFTRERPREGFFTRLATQAIVITLIHDPLIRQLLARVEPNPVSIQEAETILTDWVNRQEAFISQGITVLRTINKFETGEGPPYTNTIIPPRITPYNKDGTPAVGNTHLLGDLINTALSADTGGGGRPIEVRGLLREGTNLFVVLSFQSRYALARIPDSGAATSVAFSDGRTSGLYINAGRIYAPLQDGTKHLAFNLSTLARESANDITFPALANMADAKATSSYVYRSDSSDRVRAYTHAGAASVSNDIKHTFDPNAINVQTPGAIAGWLPTDATPLMFVVDEDDNSIVTYHFFSKQALGRSPAFNFTVGDIATNGQVMWVIDGPRRILHEYLLEGWTRTSTSEVRQAFAVDYDGEHVITTFGTTVSYRNPVGLSVQRTQRISGPEGSSGDKLATYGDILYILGGGGATSERVGALTASTGLRNIAARVSGVSVGNTHMAGIWASSTHLFVSDSNDHKIYGYDLPSGTYAGG